MAIYSAFAYLGDWMNQICQNGRRAAKTAKVAEKRFF